MYSLREVNSLFALLLYLKCVCMDRSHFVCLFVWVWPWGSAPCRHGSSSLFHCHNRMESALGCRETNKESRRVIYSIAWKNQRLEKDRVMWRGVKMLYFLFEWRNNSQPPLMSTLYVFYAKWPRRNSVQCVSLIDPVSSQMSHHTPSLYARHRHQKQA